MSERSAKAFLQDMLEAVRRILVYPENLDYSAFRQDFKTQDAVLRNLEVLGEAAKQIPEEVAIPKYPNSAPEQARNFLSPCRHNTPCCLKNPRKFGEQPLLR